MDKKAIEARHYDKLADRIGSDLTALIQQTNTKDLVLYKAHRFFEERLVDILKQKGKGVFLDYGCGPGFRTLRFVNKFWKLEGIDISSKSIELAKKVASGKNLNASYHVMDCENMGFPDSHFDVIVDYGTFSSLDMSKALPEIIRVLKPAGTIICIETLGHNPFTNLKRTINVLLGKRTKWAATHIMKMKDWKHIFQYFNEYNIYYFGFTTLLLKPVYKILMKKKIENLFLESAEKIDNLLFRIRVFRYWAFKTVIVLNKPKE